MNAIESKPALFAALAKAQQQFGPALKRAENPHLRSKYADLAACMEAVQSALNANSIALVQITHSDREDQIGIETWFIHEGEAQGFGVLYLPATKRDPQGFGSAMTYARRYSLMAACGIAPEDDDGEAAKKTTPQARMSAPPPRQTQTPTPTRTSAPPPAAASEREPGQDDEPEAPENPPPSPLKQAIRELRDAGERCGLTATMITEHLKAKGLWAADASLDTLHAQRDAMRTRAGLVERLHKAAGHRQCGEALRGLDLLTCTPAAIEVLVRQYESKRGA